MQAARRLRRVTGTAAPAVSFTNYVGPASAMVQDTSNTSSWAWTVTKTIPVGHVVMVCTGGGGGIAASSCTDSQSNSYSIIHSATTQQCASIAISKVTTQLNPGDTITITPSGSTSHWGRAYEFTSTAGSPVDTSATLHASAAAFTVGPTGTTTDAADELILFTTRSLTAVPSGYTLLDTQGSSGTNIALAANLPGSTGTFSASGTADASNTGVVLVALKP